MACVISVDFIVFIDPSRLPGCPASRQTFISRDTKDHNNCMSGQTSEELLLYSYYVYANTTEAASPVRLVRLWPDHLIACFMNNYGIRMCVEIAP